MSAALSYLRQERKLARDAWVTVWGLTAAHQLLRLPPTKPDALEVIARREARKDIAPLEAGGAASVAVVPGADVQVGAHRKREVSLVAVSAAEVQQRIQPLIDAGFVVRGVLTPALALAACARTDRNARGTAAYVAIVGRATCLAIVRDGVLLFAREMPWGHTEPDIEGRLASELKRSILFFKQTYRAPVEAVVLCGDMPNLRSLTARLGEALGTPVETLDSLVGVDAASVPAPAELFRAMVAALRLAIATGADPAPLANLVPRTMLERRESRQQIVRFAAAAAAGLLLVAGWSTMTRSTLASQRAERDMIQRELSIMEPDAVRQAEQRQAYTLTMARHGALEAFASQGPRLSRLLETIAAATPDEVILSGVDVKADGAAWRVAVRGTAISDDAAAAQAAVNALVQAVADSPYAGPAVQPPSRRVVTARAGTSAVSPTSAAGGSTVPIPAGMTGVEFAMLLQVAK